MFLISFRYLEYAHSGLEKLSLTSVQVCTRLRKLALDPVLHIYRRRYSSSTLSVRLTKRQPLYTLAPPAAAIYLTSTHYAAKKLHWSLVSIKLNRSLSRRPTLSSLVGANVIPRECCRRDRNSGDYTMARAGHGFFVERKRRLEREQLKQGLRVWMERKAKEIRKRKKDYMGVGILIWRFSKKPKGTDLARTPSGNGTFDGVPGNGHVLDMRTFWEGIKT